MSFLSTAGDRVLVQGLSGHAARRHARHMAEYGSKIVAGVVPGRGGERIDGVPVFDTVEAACAATGASTAVAFLPPGAVGDALVEDAEAGVSLAVSLTEGVASHDLVRALEVADAKGMRVVGPNSPGVMRPGQYLLGFLPVSATMPGRCALLARSGTLSYEAAFAMSRADVGLSIWIGVGGDRVKGSRFASLVPDVLADPATDSLVVVGEIGGADEEELADLLQGAARDLRVVALLAGKAAPEGVPLGHAGAIIEGGRGTYSSKRASLEDAGVIVVDRPSQIPAALLRGK
jgi:succinyl-CoA synthetase alpha subunit